MLKRKMLTIILWGLLALLTVLGILLLMNPSDEDEFTNATLVFAMEGGRYVE